jgi:glycolate oxidase
VVTADLARAAEDQGLFYPPDPASVRISTIGGNAATCAGGMRALKYGVTREYVLGLTAVLPGGRVITPGGRTHKDVVGLDLVRLMVGSAGTLGIFTELTLKLLPKPTASASVLAGFAGTADAMAAAGAVFRAGLLPAALEFMDRMALAAAARIDRSHWDEGAGVRAALLLRLDGSEACVDADLDALAAVLDHAGAVDVRTGRGADEDPLWDARRTISQAAYRLRPGKSAEDVAVPRGSVARAVEGFHAIGEELGLPVLCFGHLGDGNIHVNLLYDPDDEAERRALKKARDKVFRLALSLGGTISGEHGTGLTKGALLARQLGEDQLEIIRGIKRVFDPDGILNPGKGW